MFPLHSLRVSPVYKSSKDWVQHPTPQWGIRPICLRDLILEEQDNVAEHIQESENPVEGQLDDYPCLWWGISNSHIESKNCESGLRVLWDRFTRMSGNI